MTATLRVHEPSGSVRWSCPLPAGGLVIGRDPTSDVAFEDPSLSRRHCKVSLTPLGVQLEDLGSANGVWVGDERVEAALVASGQAFRLGQMICSVDLGLMQQQTKTLILDPESAPTAWVPAPAAAPVSAQAAPVAPAAGAAVPGTWRVPDAPPAQIPAAATPPAPISVPKPAPAMPPVGAAQPVARPVAPPVARPVVSVTPARVARPSIDLSAERRPEREAPRRRWGAALAGLFVGMLGAGALLFLTGWVDDAVQLWRPDAPEAEAPAQVEAKPAAPSLPSPRAFPEGRA